MTKTGDRDEEQDLREILAVAAETPEKPKKPATTETTRKMMRPGEHDAPFSVIRSADAAMRAGRPPLSQPVCERRVRRLVPAVFCVGRGVPELCVAAATMPLQVGDNADRSGAPFVIATGSRSGPRGPFKLTRLLSACRAFPQCSTKAFFLAVRPCCFFRVLLRRCGPAHHVLRCHWLRGGAIASARRRSRRPAAGQSAPAGGFTSRLARRRRRADRTAAARPGLPPGGAAAATPSTLLATLTPASPITTCTATGSVHVAQPAGVAIARIDTAAG